MVRQYWNRRWISRREINERKKWASAWRSNPERMRQAQAKATKAAQLARETNKQIILSAVSQELSKEPMQGAKLKATLRDFLKAHGKAYSAKAVKALTIRLTRYGVLRFDPSSGLWTIVH